MLIVEPITYKQHRPLCQDYEYILGGYNSTSCKVANAFLFIVVPYLCNMVIYF